MTRTPSRPARGYHAGVRRGFTLTEILIVVAILAVLAVVLVPNLLGARGRAFDNGARACAAALQAAQAAVYTGNGFAYIGSYATLQDRPAARDALGDACDDVSVSITTANAQSFTATVRNLRGGVTYRVTPAGIGPIGS
jgi:type IV pilus assembly protein PilA